MKVILTPGCSAWYSSRMCYNKCRVCYRKYDGTSRPFTWRNTNSHPSLCLKVLNCTTVSLHRTALLFHYFLGPWRTKYMCLCFKLKMCQDNGDVFYKTLLALTCSGVPFLWYMTRLVLNWTFRWWLFPVSFFCVEQSISALLMLVPGLASCNTRRNWSVTPSHWIISF